MQLSGIYDFHKEYRFIALLFSFRFKAVMQTQKDLNMHTKTQLIIKMEYWLSSKEK